MHLNLNPHVVEHQISAIPLTSLLKTQILKSSHSLVFSTDNHFLGFPFFWVPLLFYGVCQWNQFSHMVSRKFSKCTSHGRGNRIFNHAYFFDQRISVNSIISRKSLGNKVLFRVGVKRNSIYGQRLFKQGLPGGFRSPMREANKIALRVDWTVP